MSNVKPQKFKVKPGTIEAMQFDGKNGRDVAQWVKDNPSTYETTARNGGSWVRLTDNTGLHTILNKGDMIIKYDGNLFSALPFVEFEANYVVTKTHKLLESK